MLALPHSLITAAAFCVLTMSGSFACACLRLFLLVIDPRAAAVLHPIQQVPYSNDRGFSPPCLPGQGLRHPDDEPLRAPWMVSSRSLLHRTSGSEYYFAASARARVYACMYAVAPIPFWHTVYAHRDTDRHTPLAASLGVHYQSVTN